MDLPANAEYGWHTLAWVGLAVFAAVVFFRLGGFGIDPHENLPHENTPPAVGGLHFIAKMTCGFVLLWAFNAALQGWPFFGWSSRV